MFVLGGYQSDFARNLAREGTDLAALTGELVDGALADAALAITDVEVIHVGNAFGELFARQAQMGALPATARPALWGVPASRHEAACASGSAAILAAMADLEAGRYDVALVVGVELERSVPGDEAARIMGTAAWTGHEGETAKFLWPHMFDRIAEAYAERFGLDRGHLRAISEHNLRAARGNPRAQTRSWHQVEWSDATANPIVEGSLTRLECSQVTDGGAAIVLASDRWLAAHPRRAPRILGWGHRTAALSLEAKLARRDGPLLVPHVATAAEDARRRAGGAPIDAYEVHDCFAITEYLAIDHLGLTPPGESYRAIDDNRIARINATGGLIGGGHPVGATGIRMVLDAARQVTGRAGDCQLPDVSRVQTLNIGGSATTAISFVVGES
ncbi:MAG: acetyl-CoA acetyltransferase [Kofleriaceae bacterium]